MKKTLHFFSKKTLKKILFIGFFAFLSNIQSVKAQSVTLTPNGAWVPSLTTTARNALTATATDGQLVYDSTTKSFWYFNATEWKEINTASGDNMGNHTATQNVILGTNYLSNDGTSKGLSIDANGFATFKGNALNNFVNVGDGSNLTSILSLKSTNQEWRIGVGDGFGDIFTITDETNDETPFIIGNNNITNTLNLNNSKVGINNGDPQETLDVWGKTKTTNFQMTNGATNGNILQADASGNGTWVSPASIITAGTGLSWSGTTLNSAWTKNGSDLYTTGYSLGLGTNTPLAQLHVASSSNTVGLMESSATNGTWHSLYNTSSGGTDWHFISSGSSNSEGAGKLLFRGDGNVRMAIMSSNGNVGIGTSSPNSKLDIQGSGQITANVQSSSSHSYLVGSAPSGFESALQFKTYNAGSNFTRWSFGKSLSAESGAESGSDFFINRYNDAGSYLGTPLNISRSTGQVNVPLLSVTTANANSLNVSGAVKMAVATKTNSYAIGDTDYCLIFTGSTAGQVFTLPASPVTGRVLLIVNHGTQDLGISPAVFSGNATTLSLSSVGNEIQVIYDGTNWRIIN